MQQPDSETAPAHRRGLLADWRPLARCRGAADRSHDPWDSDDRAMHPSREATEICQRCPVQRECLREALANDEPYGTWGGLTRKQRKALVRARKRKRCPICHDDLLVVSDQMQLCCACGMSWKTVRPTRKRRQ